MKLPLPKITVDTVFNKAAAWGFLCQSESAEKITILPKSASEGWMLQFSQEQQWVLQIGGTPQIFMDSLHALKFLERRHKC